MDKKFSIIIADDDTVFPYGLKILLTKINPAYKIQLASNVTEATELLSKEKTNIIFLDIEMPGMNGAETVKQLGRDFKDLKIIIFSVHKSAELVLAMIRAGIKGYLLKESKRNNIEMAVQEVNEGGRYYSEEIHSVIQDIIKNSVLNEKSPDKKNMSRMEKKIFLLDCKGYSTKEIADKCNIDISTVGTHRSHYRDKTGVRTHHDMHIYAIETKMIDTLDFFRNP